VERPNQQSATPRVRDDRGNSLGVLEVTQEIGRVQKLTGKKRLPD
jgi:DUF438 domain-containing protein